MLKHIFNLVLKQILITWPYYSRASFAILIHFMKSVKIKLKPDTHIFVHPETLVKHICIFLNFIFRLNRFMYDVVIFNCMELLLSFHHAFLR